MERFKTFLKYLAIIFVLLLLFRGWVYRNTVNYTQIGERPIINITNKDLKKELDAVVKKDSLSLQEILVIAHAITNKKLQFSTGHTSRNPNRVVDTGKANCIGYAALFNAIVSYLIHEQNLHQKYESHHLIGKLDFMGFDLHQYVNDPFFRDHDFNEIIEIETGERYYIDPSVSDYFGIDRVSSTK